jgi:menaquinone-dependent protoporphyrinogen oxidase
MMKKIVSDKPGGLSTDTSRDHVYTDLGRVKRFVEAFLERLVREDATQLKT